MHAIAEGEDILSLRTVAQRSVAIISRELAPKGADLPVEWRDTLSGLIGGARREELDVLEHGAQRWHELLATQLDPPPLCVCDHYHCAMLLRGAKGLYGQFCYLLEL